MPTQAEKAVQFQTLHRRKQVFVSEIRGTRERRAFLLVSGYRGTFDHQRGAGICAGAARRHSQRQPRRSAGQRKVHCGSDRPAGGRRS